MNGRVTSVSGALELLVPPFENAAGDWEEIVSRASLAKPPSEMAPIGTPARHRLRRRRLAFGVVAVVIVTTLVATPAFGLRGLILGLFGRTDVSFTGKTAPLEVKRDFYDLGLGAPPSMAPNVVASQARRVASFRVRGKRHVLWVAPTRPGGFCWQMSGWYGGCRTSRHEKRAAHQQPGYVHPERLGVSFTQPVANNVAYVSLIGGDILTPDAYALSVEYADGTQTAVRFYYVSKPIDAGFFFTTIPAGHDTLKTRAIAVVLRDKSGHVIARQPFIYETPAQQAASLARAKATMKELRGKRASPPIRRSPPLPPPTRPFQRGEADGISAVAGRNGVVVFDTTRATPAAGALISGRTVGYGCFRRLPYHSDPVELLFERTTFDRVAIQIEGMSPPFMGCDVQGSYGHTWPDRNRSHSAVEIAFTPAGRHFFEDRAAARDLALFVRSKAMHTIRKLSGDALDQQLRARYGAGITRLRSRSAPLPPNRIGYVTSGTATTFIERSATGRRFYVHVVNGHITEQNVRPLAFAF